MKGFYLDFFLNCSREHFSLTINFLSDFIYNIFMLDIFGIISERRKYFNSLLIITIKKTKLN